MSVKRIGCAAACLLPTPGALSAAQAPVAPEQLQSKTNHTARIGGQSLS